MALLIHPIHPRCRAIKVVPRRAFEARLHHRGTLRVERLLVVDEHIRKLSGAYHHPDCVRRLSRILGSLIRPSK